MLMAEAEKYPRDTRIRNENSLKEIGIKHRSANETSTRF